MTNKNLPNKIIIGIGFFLIIMAIVSELNFHYIQNFRPETIYDQELFWRAEFSEVLNSMTFFVLGIVMVILGYILLKNKA
jgi:uncharacterized membrane protein